MQFLILSVLFSLETQLSESRLCLDFDAIDFRQPRLAPLLHSRAGAATAMENTHYALGWAPVACLPTQL